MTSQPVDHREAQNHQGAVLSKLTKTQQVEVLKFAQTYRIKPNDPAWLLVALLGHVRFFTDTLPARVEAAADNAVERINQQRIVEQKAFSANAMKALDYMLNTITKRVAEETKNINDVQMKRRLLINTLVTVSCLTLLITGSVVCGYLFAQGHISWGAQTDGHIIKVFSMIFNLPAGYIILPGFIIAVIMLVRYWWIDRNTNSWR